MEYRNLGRTGVKVSKFCLGCMYYGDRTSEADSIAIINKAIDSGINFLDTSNTYGRGRSEETIGKALKQNGGREHIVLATKVFGPMDDNDINAQGNNRRNIIASCEASLRRLQTDYIDLYQLHRPDYDVPIDESLRAMDDLVRAGKVRYFGTSTFAAWQVVESLWVSKELKLNRTISEQPPYHILDRRIERELVPVAQSFGLALMPYSPLAGGFLTGKYQRGQERPKGSRYGEEQYEWNERHFTDAAFDAVEELAKLALEKGCTMSQLSLAWCAQQPAVTCPIIGPRTIEHLTDNIKALKVQITEQDKDQIDTISAPGCAVVSYYEPDGRVMFGPYRYR